MTRLPMVIDAKAAPMSRIKKRLIEAAAQIGQEEPDELTFYHSVCCQCALPAAKPPADMLIWEKRQGRATLRIEAGAVLSPKDRKFMQLGLPYGPKARLLLMHLNSEAIKSQSPAIDVEDSMTAFFRRLMGDKAQDGRQIRMLKAQLSALAAATFRIGVAYDDRAVQMDSKVVGSFELWSLIAEGQRVLWPSILQLSLDYFESLKRHAVPLDERAIAALSKSATALDIYCWLAQRLHRIPIGRPQFVPWTCLHEQFGQGYSLIRQFRSFFLTQLRQVVTAYPGARISADQRGMMLENSPPPVSMRLSPIRAIYDASGR